MLYKKCRNCEFRCRCCASSYSDCGWPHCGRCENKFDEFEPATHIKRCPLDGEEIKRPLLDVNGHIVRDADRNIIMQ